MPLLAMIDFPKLMQLL